MADRTNRASTTEFEALLNAQFSSYRKGFNPGAKMPGTVLRIGLEQVAIDVNAKREGMIDIAEFRDAEGQVKLQPGDVLDVTFVGQKDGAFVFTTRTGGRASASNSTIAAAFAAGLTLEGAVQSEINGGYEVLVAGQRAFCPYSQISLFRQDGAVYVGQKFLFQVSEYDPESRNVIVSRRQVLEKEREAQREALQASIEPGQVRTGKVSRITEFGVFVDLGGIDGLIPLKELAWQRDVKPEDIVKPGDSVQVQVRETDWERGRISLSLRGAQEDPWDAVADRYPVGSALRGKVTRIERFGAFVEIIPGVEGLIPIGKLGGGRRLMSAREVVSEGQEMNLKVESVDRERRRISLSPIDERVQSLKPGELTVGSEVEGIVEGIKDFGVFVRLSEKQTGLLHISETDLPKGGSAAAKLERAFPPSTKIKVVVKSIEGERLSLTTPAKWLVGQGRDEDDSGELLAQHRPSGKGLGSMGDVFANLKL
ncbi:MAG: S1 RNA-binding domain-containing protein [Kiritimatiellia bacterium]